MKCATCDDALQKTCGGQCHDMKCTFTCASCAGEHQQALHEAGCDNDAIAAWCAGAGPAPPPAAVVHFPGSRIILNNATWGDDVNTWAKEPPAQVWELCYSSITDNHATPATFHAQCDPHSISRWCSPATRWATSSAAMCVAFLSLFVALLSRWFGDILRIRCQH